MYYKHVDEKTCIIIKTLHLMMQMKKTCIEKLHLYVDEKHVLKKHLT